MNKKGTLREHSFFYKALRLMSDKFTYLCGRAILSTCKLNVPSAFFSLRDCIFAPCLYKAIAYHPRCGRFASLLNEGFRQLCKAPTSPLGTFSNFAVSPIDMLSIALYSPSRLPFLPPITLSKSFRSVFSKLYIVFSFTRFSFTDNIIITKCKVLCNVQFFQKKVFYNA